MLWRPHFFSFLLFIRNSPIQRRILEMEWDSKKKRWAEQDMLERTFSHWRLVWQSFQGLSCSNISIIFVSICGFSWIFWKLHISFWPVTIQFNPLTFRSWTLCWRPQSHGQFRKYAPLSLCYDAKKRHNLALFNIQTKMLIKYSRNLAHKIWVGKRTIFVFFSHT